MRMLTAAAWQALHLTVAAAEDNDVVGIGEVRHMDGGSNLNPVLSMQLLFILQAFRLCLRRRRCKTQLHEWDNFAPPQSMSLKLTFVYS